MQLVVDANILFKALIGKGKVLRILFSDKINPLAPEFLFEEFEKHKSEIAEKGKTSVLELEKALSSLKECMQIIPSEEVSSSIKSKSKLLSPHPKDEAYFAVALAFNAAIWSDEKLFKKQSEIKTLNTSELVELLDSSIL
jgi:predicted nucleic acid-binding protein